MSNEQSERWYVQFDSQEVRLMTLDELDDAFQKGLVHEETYVIPVGATEWQTLGAILGGGDEGDEAVASDQSTDEVSSGDEPSSVVAGSVSVSVAAPVPALEAPARAAAPVSAWPPVASSNNNSLLPTPQSVVPLVQDVAPALDDDAAAFKPKKGKFAIVAALAAAALGGLGFAITRLDAPPAAESPSHAAALAPAPAPTYAELAKPSTPPEPAAAPTTPPASADTASPSNDSSSSASKGSLSEDMKAALLASDKERADNKKKGRSTKPAKAAVSRRASAKSSGGSNPIKSSGNAHDPLNGAL